MMHYAATCQGFVFCNFFKCTIIHVLETRCREDTVCPSDVVDLDYMYLYNYHALGYGMSKTIVP